MLPADPPSPLLLHFLHPLARSLHQRLLSALLGLSRTISALSETPDADMSVAEQEMMYLASQVLEDAVSGDGIGGLERWKSLLRKVADIEGLDQSEHFPLPSDAEKDADRSELTTFRRSFVRIELVDPHDSSDDPPSVDERSLSPSPSLPDPRTFR